MITAIRSAVFCDKVENDERGVSYIGLHGETLRADSQPGIVHAWLALLVDLDRKPSTGAVKIEAEGFSQAFPFAVPAGPTLTAMAFPLIIPVLTTGPLKVSVRNEAGGKPLRVSWTLGFTKDAKILDLDAADAFVASANEAAETLRSSAAARASAKH